MLTSATKQQHNYFVRIDIANFYDNIDLHYLERLLRIAVDRSRQQTVDLLFSFLRTWNRTGGQYALDTRGLPTEEIGDSSRLFAHFYIQSYDHAMQRHCESLNGDASYFRFADDQWIMTTERRHAEHLIIRAAEELRSLGLSINSSKVLHIGSMDDFLFYWGHDVFEPLDVKEDPDIVGFAERALSLLDNASSVGKPWRRESIENALLERIHHPSLPVEYRNRIYDVATRPKKIRVLENRVMNKIYRSVDQERQRTFWIFWIAAGRPILSISSTTTMTGSLK